MWIITDRRDEQLARYSSFEHRCDAYLVLRKAIERLPNKGCKISEKKDNDL